MLKNLKLLLKLRAWLKSDTLKTGGIVGVLSAAQIFLQSDDGAGWLDWISALIGVSTATGSGIVLGTVSLAMLVLRAKTEIGLAEK